MKKLPCSAYVPDPDQPFVPLTFGLQLPEFTWKAAISGIVLGMLFGAANTYLGLKAGLTIASLLGSSLVFYLFGWTDALGKATALMVGLVVCVAASIAGDTSQDLKTGFILARHSTQTADRRIVGCAEFGGCCCRFATLGFVGSRCVLATCGAGALAAHELGVFHALTAAAAPADPKLAI